MTTPIPGCWGPQLRDEPAALAWLWHGYLAAGNVTLLTSQWKSGKTTLISILLSRLKTGGTLAGLPLLPLKPGDKRSFPRDSQDPLAKAIILSEESRAQWRLRQEKLDLDHVYFICQPFRGKPSPEEWLDLIDHAADLHLSHGTGLFVIDTLTTFLPGRTEAVACTLMESLLPLRRLTAQGMCVLILHHPAKGDPLPGQAARGSGALASFTDINLEMGWASKAADAGDHRRRILAHSRYEDTPRQLVLELTPDGTDYLVHGDFSQDEFTQQWDRLRMVLEDVTGKKTRHELLAAWPRDFPRPGEATLWRWLQRAVAAGLVCQEGTGRRADPFRYWLPGLDRLWLQDPMYALEHDRQQTLRWLDQQLTGR